jgi:hypothetical protein
MKPREKMLAAFVGAIAVLFVIYTAYEVIAGAFGSRESQKANLDKQVAEKKALIAQGSRAADKIRDWNRRSLPTDPEAARQLYMDWLIGLTDNAKFSNADTQLMGQRAAKPTGKEEYEEVKFSVKGETDITLKELVHFLVDFYSSKHLQRINKLTLTPAPGGKKVMVDMEIYALVLPGADRRDTLLEEKADKLALGGMGDYEKKIADRKLFSEYTPPPRNNVAERNTSPKPAADPAKFAVVTGFVEENDRPEIWVLQQLSGTRLTLQEGDEFNIGDSKFKVVRIGNREAVLLADGKPIQVRLGGNLRDAPPAPDDEL